MMCRCVLSVSMSPSSSSSLGVVIVVVVLLLLQTQQSNASFWDSVRQTKDNDEKDDAVIKTIKLSDIINNSHHNNNNNNIDEPVHYGVDVSFPIQHSKVSTNYPWLPHNVDPTIPIPKEYEGMVIQPLGNRQAFYDDFIQGCVEAFGRQGQRCIATENDRFEMSLRQPQSMQNYTQIGFKKIKAPKLLFDHIKRFWDANKDNANEEKWGVGNTYTNNWLSKSSMVSVEDTRLRGAGAELKQRIWDAARDVIGEWTGQDLTQCSLYGIRVYKPGAILATHVDRLPLVSSAIINVDQDLDEPWPLEVIGHDGRAYNVTMEPGDMVLYESHSVLHGRPYPLKGRFMANLFVHFEPTGHTLRHHANLEGLDLDQDVNAKYRDSIMKGHGGHENAMASGGLPPYVLAGTPEEKHWRDQHPQGYKSQRRSFTTGSTNAHSLARKGSAKELELEIKLKKSLVNAKDENGWTPLHEGVRGGHLDVVRLLVENGADVNAVTHGKGGSALWWAKQQHKPDHPVVEFLESIGALEVGPEL